jgi:bacterioferritin (cytochrome b1)
MIKSQQHCQFINLMLKDLQNEKKHMMFYLTASATVTGLHREEYRELFAKEAASEMQHVMEFQDAVLGMGANLVECTDLQTLPDFLVSYQAKELLNFALQMEEEVVANYAKRISEDVNMLDNPEKQWMEIFYEDQLAKSRKDVDNLKMILKGCNNSCHLHK